MTELAEQDVPCCKNAENYEMCARFVKAFEIIGKKWNGLIISSLCDTKAMRFRDLAHAVGACSDRFWSNACGSWKLTGSSSGPRMRKRRSSFTL